MASMSGMSPVVSVVMSCFNDEQHVDQAIKSVQKQSFTDWELIVINDGSSDKTGEILNRLAAADSRVRVIQQANMGLTVSLIRGCEVARGEFIARHDADDVSLSERFEKQVALLRADRNVGFVSCWADSFAPNGAVLDQFRTLLSPTDATARLLFEREGPPAHGSVMMRRSVYEQVGGYRPGFYFGQDSDLWLRMAERSQFGYVHDVLYRFLRSPRSISGKKRHIQRRFGELGRLCQQARLLGQSEAPLLLAAERLSGELRFGSPGLSELDSQSHLAMTYLIGSQLVANKDARARTYLWQVIRQQPVHLKAWVRLIQSYLNGRKLAISSEESPK